MTPPTDEARPQITVEFPYDPEDDAKRSATSQTFFAAWVNQFGVTEWTCTDEIDGRPTSLLSSTSWEMSGTPRSSHPSVRLPRRSTWHFSILRSRQRTGGNGPGSEPTACRLVN